MCVCGNVIHVRQLSNVSVSLLFRFRCAIPYGISQTVSCFGLGFWGLGFWCCLSNATLQSPTSHKSRAGNPSIRSPASNEMIFDSVELWDTDVCFLHIQLVGTNARCPKYIRSPPMLTLSPQVLRQNPSLGTTNPMDTAKQCYRHDNIIGSHPCDECLRLVWPVVGHMLLSIL